MAIGGFVDSTTGDDGDSGQTLDLAWATLEYALESGSLVAGDSVAIRPVHTEIPLSDIVPAYDGATGNPIKIFGIPRLALEITSASWTNGSATVDDILPASLLRNVHQARYITGPDGEQYTIFRVVDSNTFRLDREYTGTTATLTDGASTIQADPTQSDWDDYDDSLDTIKKADWEASEARPIIDFNDGAFQMGITAVYNVEWSNIEFIDSADANGIAYIRNSYNMIITGCLFKQNAYNEPCIVFNNVDIVLKRTTCEGSGSGSGQVGMVLLNYAGGLILLKDSAIYNMGSFGMEIGNSQNFMMNNVNIGVEIENGNSDITLNGTVATGIDLKLGGNNGYVEYDSLWGGSAELRIENYQKILGEHKTFYRGGSHEKAAVSGETPNKKVSDYVIKITPDGNYLPTDDFVTKLFVHELEMTAAAHTLKYWIYNDLGVTINDGDAKADIWLKAEYIKAYDDTSEYIPAEIFSAENTILDAGSADDWDSLSVTLTPAVASKVRLTIYINLYSAAGELFIDPALVIS